MPSDSSDEINFYFSGGGIYFWWQAGVATYIQEKKNLNPKLKVNYLGSSAGALSAALLYSNVSMSKAAEYAIYQAEREKLFTKPSGLAFVWGKIVKEWLDVLIDEKAIENNRNTELYIKVTPVNVFKNGFKPIILNNFTTKADVIDACLCSCHIPLFMDTKLYNKYQGKRYLDGSFYPFMQSLLQQYSLENDISQFNKTNVAIMDWQADEIFLNSNKKSSFVELVTPDNLYRMMEYGYNYMKNEDESKRLFL
jgi:hypothetical protein